jgi:hypothetical protein
MLESLAGRNAIIESERPDEGEYAIHKGKRAKSNIGLS